MNSLMVCVKKKILTLPIIINDSLLINSFKGETEKIFRSLHTLAISLYQCLQTSKNIKIGILKTNFIHY